MTIHIIRTEIYVYNRKIVDTKEGQRETEKDQHTTYIDTNT